MAYINPGETPEGSSAGAVQVVLSTEQLQAIRTDIDGAGYVQAGLICALIVAVVWKG